MQIAKLYEVSGMTQTEVAEEASRMLRRPVSQSAVHRAKVAVNRWRKANPDLGLPQIEGRKGRSRSLKADTVDPKVIELGPRTDGRAKPSRRNGDAS